LNSNEKLVNFLNEQIKIECMHVPWSTILHVQSVSDESDRRVPKKWYTPTRMKNKPVQPSNENNR